MRYFSTKEGRNPSDNSREKERQGGGKGGGREREEGDGGRECLTKKKGWGERKRKQEVRDRESAKNERRGSGEQVNDGF